MIYTSYYGQLKNLREDGIVPISISRGKPHWYHGEALDSLAPTWDMIHLGWDEYEPRYMEILAKNNAKHIVENVIKGRDVALLCYEKDIEDCHRKYVLRWLRENGYECEEYSHNNFLQRSETGGMRQLQLAF